MTSDFTFESLATTATAASCTSNSSLSLEPRRTAPGKSTATSLAEISIRPPDHQTTPKTKKDEAQSLVLFFVVKHIVNFSGGVCSFWAAKRVIARHGTKDVVLLFADTLIEHPSLYRFNEQCS